MSAGGHSHDHDVPHDDHGDDDDHHAAEPPPDEPQSPGWLPLLGGALFLAALLLFLVTRSPEADEPELEPEAPPSVTAVEAAAEAPSPEPVPAPAPAPARVEQPGHEGHGH